MGYQDEFIFPRIIYNNRDPGSFDDDSQGYVPGQPWVNTDTKMYWMCLKNTINDAYWTNLSQQITIVDDIRNYNTIDYFNKIIYCLTTKQVYYADTDIFILLSWNIIRASSFRDLPCINPLQHLPSPCPDRTLNQFIYHKRLGWVINEKQIYYCDSDNWIPLTIDYVTGEANLPGCYGKVKIYHNLGVEPGFVEAIPMGRSGNMWIIEKNDQYFIISNNTRYKGPIYWFACVPRSV